MSKIELLGRALSSMKEALLLLDQSDAAADIGAHLDLAINRLQQTIDSASVTVPREAQHSHQS